MHPGHTLIGCPDCGPLGPPRSAMPAPTSDPWDRGHQVSALRRGFPSTLTLQVWSWGRQHPHHLHRMVGPGFSPDLLSQELPASRSGRFVRTPVSLRHCPGGVCIWRGVQGAGGGPCPRLTQLSICPGAQRNVPTWLVPQDLRLQVTWSGLKTDPPWGLGEPRC